MRRNPFHLVDFSPWPLTGSIGALFLTSGLVGWFQGYSPLGAILGFILILIIILQWWRDVIRETTFQGFHTMRVSKGLLWGIILFIASEVLFFFAFFLGGGGGGAYFHSRLAPSLELGSCWPPAGITPLNPFEVPLLNTGVLLASGVTVIWAHHSLMEGDRLGAIQGLGITVSFRCILYFTYFSLFCIWSVSFGKIVTLFSFFVRFTFSRYSHKAWTLFAKCASLACFGSSNILCVLQTSAFL